ncbi:PREDICTED: uncharacterized protein LOC109193600 isoform X2 [Ipomoea nil]|uniref:uncharacterized protein LOC109193600 isoform X2 n=1 Tax=Ipomoea nil TaxID=35883 RepID=UPI000900CCAA|nr:PREDICTED: uncharacterized protein LOC109193600 isoform X2 [Ipomoea nil]
MIGVRAKLRAGFCMSRRTVAHVCARSPIQPYKKSGSLIRADEKAAPEFSSKNSEEMSFNSQGSKPESDQCGGGNNRVMVVVDKSLEAKAALQWALSHTVQSQDTVILVHVTKPSKQGELDQRSYELLSSMKNMCQTRRPGVQVEIQLQEGKEKGPVIVEAAKQQKVSLLVLGQRKRSMMWRLHTMWSGKRARPKVVNYCIQNANCMTIAVRRKSRKHGGYLITTKRHKDFWLLA